MEIKLTSETKVDFETLTEREKGIFEAGKKQGKDDSFIAFIWSFAIVISTFIFTICLHGYVRHSDIWYHF